MRRESDPPTMLAFVVICLGIVIVLVITAVLLFS